RIPRQSLYFVLASLALLAAALLSVPADDPKAGPGDLTVVGYLAPIHRAQVFAGVPGRIVELRVQIGDKVKKGDVLAKLDDTEYRLEAELAEARLHEAQARVAAQKAVIQVEIQEIKAKLEAAKAKYELAAAQKARIEELIKQAALPERELLEAKNRLVQNEI